MLSVTGILMCTVKGAEKFDTADNVLFFMSVKGNTITQCAADMLQRRSMLLVVAVNLGRCPRSNTLSKTSTHMRTTANATAI